DRAGLGLPASHPLLDGQAGHHRQSHPANGGTTVNARGYSGSFHDDAAQPSARAQSDILKDDTMRLGIDAANLRSGGTITHLDELLRHADPAAHGIERIVVWGSRALVDRLPQRRSWLEKVHVPVLDGGLLARWQWQRSELPRVAQRECDVLFAPG